MLQFAIPIGRWFGVHIRLHLSFFVLLALSAGYSSVATGSIVRGVGLWLALCAAVVVREIARAIAAAYAGVPLRALFLLPFGGVMALEPREGGVPQSSQRLIALTGSFANLGVAVLLLAFSYGIDPHVALLRQPWITIEHILRSAVWLQAALGLINLVPAKRLSTAGLLRMRPTPASAATPAADAPPLPAKPSPGFGLLTALAIPFILAGIFLTMLWPILFGATLLFMSYFSRVASAGTADASTLTVSDVMLTEFVALPASGTLRDALRRANHTLQDTFPVLRGDRLVGWTSRTALATRLQAEGDGYLQGSMVRSLQVASPGEKLGEALRRAAALGASEFIPVVQDGAMVGMLTPASLERAVGQIRLTQPPPERGDA